MDRYLLLQAGKSQSGGCLPENRKKTGVWKRKTLEMEGSIDISLKKESSIIYVFENRLFLLFLFLCHFEKGGVVSLMWFFKPKCVKLIFVKVPMCTSVQVKYLHDWQKLLFMIAVALLYIKFQFKQELCIAFLNTLLREVS